MQKYFYILIGLLLFSVQSCKDDEGSDATITKPTLSILDAEFFEGSETNTVQVTVRLAGENASNVLVNYSTINGTAFSGSDFIAISNGELLFTPNDTEKTISLVIKGDDLNEQDEDLEILLLNPSNATLLDERATITIKNDDSPNDNYIPDGGYSTPTSYADMTLVWGDEFQNSEVNEADWTFEIGNGDGGWGNNELQYYKSQNTTIELGEYMVIEAKEEFTNGFNYSSSRLVTKDKKEFQYGRIDIRAALPQGRGLWPAIWMLGANIDQASWPACGEIDIMELVGNAPNQVHGTVHYGSTFSNHQYHGGSTLTPNGGNFADNFHVFSLVWEEDLLQFLVDDELYYEVTPSDMQNGQPYPFNQEFFFVFNVAVGGAWPGNPDGSTVFPQRMVVDYVRAFQ
ncbi:MAG: beta-glucanase (GH16 family) [Maribacter sp.]|jgi:beta-glucanase (GH16 family)